MPVQIRMGVSHQPQKHPVMKKHGITMTICICICILICSIVYSKNREDNMPQLLKANIEALSSFED